MVTVVMQDVIEVVWNHLAELLEFALALSDTLHRINSQSFNNFMLRIGEFLKKVIF